MMTMILKDIKYYIKLMKRIYEYRISQLNETPKLAIIQVGNVEASSRYIRNKVKDCEEVGIIAHVYHYDEDITEQDLCYSIKLDQEFYDGVIVQLPLPPHIRQEAVVAAIKPEKDVDGFRIDSWYKPATPKGIMDYLKYCEYDLTSKHVVIFGRSEIVGKPLARMMTDADATVTLCHSKTKNGLHFASNADLVVSAVGKPQFLDCEIIRCPVIDIGINFDENGKLVGDCYNIDGRDVTPVPGGVGLLTRAALLDNVISAREFKEKNIDE